MGERKVGQKDPLFNMSGLRAQLTRVTGSAELAADLLQDALVTVLQKLDSGEIHAASQLDGYVYRVALNHLRNYRRKDRSRSFNLQSVSDPEGGTEPRLPTDSVEADQWMDIARKLLQEVGSVRDRELLVRFYLQEEDKEALCREFGLTELHFNRVVFRARNRFRRLLERRGLQRSDFLPIIAILSLIGEGVSSHGIHFL
jgi:RNA polymerase sigma-70 factor, ECF subfamily